jgi:hypothetical protein
MSYYFSADYDIEEVVKLRKLAFHLKFQDRVQLQGLEWNNTDKHSLHFSLRNQHKLLATLRITFYNDQTKFESATQIPLKEKFEPPFVLLARAATHPEFENIDLHAKLRVLALEYCLLKNADTIFGSLQKKSHRLNHLLNLGYEIISTVPAWLNSYIQSDGEVALIAIQNKETILRFISLERNRLNYHEKIDFQNLDSIVY